MWAQVQKLLHTAPNGSAKASGSGSVPPILPLRTPVLPLDKLGIGCTISFSVRCPLPELAGKQVQVIAVRHYRFGDDSFKNYQLQLGGQQNFFVTVAEDEQGHYLSFSRGLDEADQDRWFGRDALSFFTESSTAKTIRCKADRTIEGAWAAERYVKSVDWVEGEVSAHASGRAARSFHYNLLTDSVGEKALEIEHDDETGENRIFVTVYRPITDMATIDAGKAAPAKAVKPAEEKAADSEVLSLTQRIAEAVAESEIDDPQDVPLFRPAKELMKEEVTASVEEYVAKVSAKQRPDFRRLVEEQAEEIRVARTEALRQQSHDPIAEIPIEDPVAPEDEHGALPSFLLERSGDYVALDEIIPPEAERVRVGLKAARSLIDRALNRNVRVRDVLRDMLGLDSIMADEVIFELPLSDDDYRKLAMRYKLRPDHRTEIRARVQEELRKQLSK